MSPEAKRASLRIGTVLVGMAAVIISLVVLYVGFLGCILASSGCQLVGTESILVIGGAMAVFGVTVLATRAAERGQPTGRHIVLLVGACLVGYATWVAIRRRQGIAAPLDGAEQVLLLYASFAGAAFLIVVLGAGSALILGTWPDGGPVRALVAVPLVVAAGAGVLSLVGPEAPDDAARPEVSADRVLLVRVTQAAVELEPERLAEGEADIVLQGSRLRRGETLFLLGPVTQENLDALAAGDIDWRGDYFYPTSSDVVAENFSGPASGYLGRVPLIAGRYALFTTTDRLTQMNSTTFTSELVRGPWTVLTVE